MVLFISGLVSLLNAKGHDCQSWGYKFGLDHYSNEIHASMSRIMNHPGVVGHTSYTGSRESETGGLEFQESLSSTVRLISISR